MASLRLKIPSGTSQLVQKELNSACSNPLFGQLKELGLFRFRMETNEIY